MDDRVGALPELLLLREPVRVHKQVAEQLSEDGLGRDLQQAGLERGRLLVRVALVDVGRAEGGAAVVGARNGTAARERCDGRIRRVVAALILACVNGNDAGVAALLSFQCRDYKPCIRNLTLHALVHPHL